jgi:capsular polysaccharide transport system ATP-binding protein
MIELRNITKTYPVKNGLRYILRDVSLVIPDHANVAVLGPNGAGKSTFLRLIGGTEPADSGTIISDCRISWPFGLTSGFQGSLTGRQNVLFVCRINGLSPDQTREVIRQVTDFAEIGEYFDMPVSSYSSGMRGRLSFGLSVCFHFDVYLIDELTSVGDAIFREKAKAAFERIRKRAALLYVSHSLSSLRESCQSALFLRDGQADYYPDIKDGIEAYMEYIRLHRNHGMPKDANKPKRAAKNRRKKNQAKRAATRFPNPATLNQQAPTPIPPISHTDDSNLRPHSEQ